MECAAAKDGEERIPAGEIFLCKNQDIVGTFSFCFSNYIIKLKYIMKFNLHFTKTLFKLCYSLPYLCKGNKQTFHYIFHYSSTST